MDYSIWGTAELIEELESKTGKVGHYDCWGDSELISELDNLA